MFKSDAAGVGAGGELCARWEPGHHCAEQRAGGWCRSVEHRFTVGTLQGTTRLDQESHRGIVTGQEKAIRTKATKHFKS